MSMQTPGQEKRLAFIVGGSGGIGRAISLSLAKQGYDLLIHGGSNQDSLNEICKTASLSGVTATAMLHRFSSIAEFMKAIPIQSTPDILVVAFGPIIEGTLGESDPLTWQFMVDANLGLPGALVSHFAPHMAKRRFGRIILFGGTNTDQIRGFTEVSAYSAAKTGLGVLAKSAAKEFGAFNVSCNVLCPGYVQTEYYSESIEKKAKRRMPGNLFQTPENMAKLVKTLIDDSENGLNGAILSCAHGM